MAWLISTVIWMPFRTLLPQSLTAISLARSKPWKISSLLSEASGRLPVSPRLTPSRQSLMPAEGCWPTWEQKSLQPVRNPIAIQPHHRPLLVLATSWARMTFRPSLSPSSVGTSWGGAHSGPPSNLQSRTGRSSLTPRSSTT